jgi:hypothetical protein
VWRHPILRAAFVAYIVWGAWTWLRDRPVHPGDGVLVSTEPEQGATPSTQVRIGRWLLTPRASYHITARSLGIERYRIDSLASLVPEDLALGWGPMSDNRLLSGLSIDQSNRFYYWRFTRPPLVPSAAIISHSANTHVIPADRLVAAQLGRLRRGQVVELTGDLVDGARDDGARISTSLVRTDTGAGACEVMLVREIRVVP